MQTINNIIFMKQIGQDHEENEEHNEETQRNNAGIYENYRKSNQN